MRPPVVVYCDFDGTITQDDVIDVLLTELADPAWKDVEALWVQGIIGSRECLARQIPLIRGGWKTVLGRLRSMRLDPTFPAFASWCRATRIPLHVVSDGLDRIIETLLERHGVTVDSVWANHLEESTSGELSITFPHPSSDPRCWAGLCKCGVMADGSPHATAVVIGDGQSDLCWARRADWLFAKSALLTRCRQDGVRCTGFQDFGTIRTALERHLEPLGESELLLTGRQRTTEDRPCPIVS